MNKTAVEWLIDQLIPKDQHEGIMDIIQEAKEMEKQQIIDAYRKGFSEGVCFGVSPTGYNHISADEYFNKTFKNC